MNITWQLEDMNFISLHQKQYFTHLLCLFIKYCFANQKSNSYLRATVWYPLYILVLLTWSADIIFLLKKFRLWKRFLSCDVTGSRWGKGRNGECVLSTPSRPAGLKYRSEVIVLPIQNVYQTLVKANLRPEQKLLGLRLPFTSVWDTFCIGKTMACDLWPAKETCS